MATKSTTNDFISKSQLKHCGQNYDYGKVIYLNNKTPVCIVCPKHGEFLQTPNDHIDGCGCPICGKENNAKLRTKTTELFINEAKDICKNFYDYSKSKYVGCCKNVIIICPKHGIFLKVPNDHLRGQKCRQCGYEERHNNNGFKWKSC